ncbi:MAG: hypothetical protein WCO10_01635 [bacterium]
MNKTGKIGAACFVGGAIFVWVALLVNPKYLWVAALSGASAGYLGYEFREVLRCMPIAFNALITIVTKVFLSLVRVTKRGLKSGWEWLHECHPFQQLGLLVAIVPLEITTGICLAWLHERPPGWYWLILGVLLIAEAVIAVGIVVYIPIVIIARLFSFIGARYGEKKFWRQFVTLDKIDEIDQEVKSLIEKGYTEAPLTYSNVSRWFFKGLVLAVYGIVWKVPVILLRECVFKIIILELCLGIGGGLWNLVVLIHKKERVLCAIDSVIGGSVAWFTFAVHASSSPEKLFAVVCGGILGAFVGVLNYELVSKRLLKVVPVHG